MSTLEPFVPDRALYPFDSRWFQSSVGQVHYLDEGSGPPILFLHGNPTWSFLYRGIVIRLRKLFRCIAMDYPGFGLSVHPPTYGYTAAEHADVVSELVRELGLDDLTIMGQDWGGPIGMRVALNERGRMRSMVMGNTWYWPERSIRSTPAGSRAASGRSTTSTRARDRPFSSSTATPRGASSTGASSSA